MELLVVALEDLLLHLRGLLLELGHLLIPEFVKLVELVEVGLLDLLPLRGVAVLHFPLVFRVELLLQLEEPLLRLIGLQVLASLFAALLVLVENGATLGPLLTCIPRGRPVEVAEWCSLSS